LPCFAFLALTSNTARCDLQRTILYKVYMPVLFWFFSEAYSIYLLAPWQLSARVLYVQPLLCNGNYFQFLKKNKIK
jgi:hypothetical protein